MLNRAQIAKNLKSQIKAIVYESSEDEGAAEFEVELQSVLDVIEKEGSTDEEIVKAADWVGVNLNKFIHTSNPPSMSFDESESINDQVRLAYE